MNDQPPLPWAEDARPHPWFLTMAERLALSENDDDNARRLLSVYGPDMLFVLGRGWAIWDGARYSFEAGELAAFEIASNLRKLVEAEADFAAREWDPPAALLMAECEASPRSCPDFDTARLRLRRAAAARLHKHAIKCGNVAKVKSVLESMEHRRRAMVEDLDSDPFQFIAANGAIDLLAARNWEPPEGMVEEEELAARAGWLVPVDRTKLPTRASPTVYDPAATCPEFDRFLALICPDAGVRGSLLRILGAMLFGENRAQVCVFIRGPGGNGKSTLLNALQATLGTRSGYAATCKVEMFLETGMIDPGRANPEEVDLPGARAFIATEPSARDVLSAKKIKALTGGDRRMSRGNFKDPFFWTPRGVPIISCNRMVKIKDEDEGTRRRIVILPLEVNLRALPPEQQVPPGKIDRILAAEAPGILNRLIDGFRDFWAKGIAPAPRMSEIKAALLEGADPVGVFLEEMTVACPKGRINVTDFYKVHERWCEEEGRTLYQMKTVGDIMVEKGFDRGKSSGLSVWRGLTWAETARAHLDALHLAPPRAPDAPAHDHPF